MKTIKSGRLFRTMDIPRENADKEARTISLSFSSELPVERFFGVEILDHSPGAVRLDRLKNGGAVLVDHNSNDQVGVVEDVIIGTDRKGRAAMRFGKSARAEEIFSDVMDGIRRHVSVGYQIHQMVLEEKKEGKETYRATDWEPVEISIVPVPADPTVGIGRSGENEHEIQITKKEERTMETAGVNIEEEKSKAAIGERTRVNEMLALGEKFKTGDMAREFIASGKTVEEFRGAILEKMGKVDPLMPPDPNIGLSEKEKRQFSFLRAINALSNPLDRKAQEEASFEREVSSAVSKKFGKAARGLYVPNDVMSHKMEAITEAFNRIAMASGRRDLVVGTATAGGNLVATDMLAASFIELLRNRMKMRELGAMMLDGLVGNVAIPRQTGGGTAYWVTENAAVTESQQTIGQVTMSPKTVGAFTDIARQLLMQSSLDVEAFVRADLAAILALAIDLAAINGSGASGQPTGILGTTGIGDVAGGTNGAAPTYANMVELETDVAAANADVAGMALLATPEIRGKLKQTARFANSDTPTWEPNGTVNGYPAHVSNQLPKTLTKGTSSDCHAIIFGNWRDLIIGQWGALDLLVDPYTGGAAGTVRVRVLQSVDIAVRHAESFSAMKDARNV